MITALARRLGALVLLALLLGGLHRSGAGLGPVPPTDLADLAVTIRLDPLAATAWLLRLAAMATAVWLAGVTVLDTAALVLRRRPLGRLASHLAPRAWRSLVLRPVALATLALPPVALPLATVAPAAAMAPSTPGIAGATDTAVALDRSTTGPTELQMVLHHSDRPMLTMSVVRPPPPSPTATGLPAIDEPAPTGSTHVVGPGENLWSIAASRLGQELGRRPAPSEVTPYWRLVIAANRHALPDPDNPDLIHRGIELTMPPVGP